MIHKNVPNKENQEMYDLTMYYVPFMYDLGDVQFCR